MTVDCWNCGKPTSPKSTVYLSMQHQYHCLDCDVCWVTPEYWLVSERWKDVGGYEGYLEFRRQDQAGSLRRYKLEADELVDFSKPDAPATVA